jgi:hypothetical protein
MTTYNHVTNPKLKALLINGFNGDEDSICQALTYTESCLNEDMQNEDIPYSVLDQRESAFISASEAWNDLADGQESVEYLRAFWG